VLRLPPGATACATKLPLVSKTLAGSFTDPTLPAGYVPYSVHAIGTQVFVTYALRATTGGPTIAPGDGMVNVAGSSATFVLSAAPTNKSRSTTATSLPPNFGGDLLVGNFSGTVALGCSSLPEAATCTFSPTSDAEGCGGDGESPGRGSDTRHARRSTI
jgi:hypothetical protein